MYYKHRFLSVSPDLVINLWSFLNYFLFGGTLTFGLKSRVSLWAVNLFLCFSIFLLSKEDIICCSLPVSGWVPLVCDPSRSIPVAPEASLPNFRASFLWLHSNPSYRCSTSSLSFHLLVRILLYPSLGFLIRAAVHVGMLVFFWLTGFSASRTRCGNVRSLAQPLLMAFWQVFRGRPYSADCIFPRTV